MKLKCVTGKPKKASQTKCSSGNIYVYINQNLQNSVYSVHNTVRNAQLGLIQFAFMDININKWEFTHRKLGKLVCNTTFKN